MPCYINNLYNIQSSFLVANIGSCLLTHLNSSLLAAVHLSTQSILSQAVYIHRVSKVVVLPLFLSYHQALTIHFRFIKGFN